MAGPALAAQTFRQKDFDAYVARALQALRTPGASIAVVKDGRVLFAKGYGVRTLGGGDTARVDAHTLFQIASNTKAFTTAALAILADEGKLSWDDPVTKFLPGFQLYDPYVTRDFTVRDLVTHRSGLGLGAGDLLWFHSNYNRGEIAYRIRFARPVSSFRSAYAYDNVLYIVAGEIFPAVAAQSWDDFVKNRIFVPLGMTESGTTTAFFTSSRNAATPHGVEDGKLQVVPLDSVDNISPAGGIASNVTDLARWLVCRLDSGRYASGGARLFSERQGRGGPGWQRSPRPASSPEQAPTRRSRPPARGGIRCLSRPCRSPGTQARTATSCTETLPWRSRMAGSCSGSTARPHSWVISNTGSTTRSSRAGARSTSRTRT